MGGDVPPRGRRGNGASALLSSLRAPCKPLHGTFSCKAWPQAQAQPAGGQPLPTAALLFPGELRAQPSQARELPAGISALALRYQPWASIQGSFPSCVLSGSSASIAAVPGPVPGPQESPQDSGGG